MSVVNQSMTATNNHHFKILSNVLNRHVNHGRKGTNFRTPVQQRNTQNFDFQTTPTVPSDVGRRSESTQHVYYSTPPTTCDPGKRSKSYSTTPDRKDDSDMFEGIQGISMRLRNWAQRESRKNAEAHRASLANPE